MGNQMEQIEKPASATSPVNVASKDSAAGNAPEGPPEKKDASNTASSAPSPLKRGGSVDSKTGGPTKKRKSAVDEEPKNGKPGNENPVEQIEKPHEVVPASAASSVNVASKDGVAGNAPAGPSEKKDASNPATKAHSPLNKGKKKKSTEGIRVKN